MSSPATEIVIPYAPRAQQRALHERMRQHRFAVIVAHRRMGKTVWAINHLLREVLTCPKERPRYAYVAPTYRQAKAIAWDYLLHYSRPIPGIGVHVTELRVDYPHGGQIRLYGADYPDSLRGIYLDGVVLDEYGMMPADTFSTVLRPALADRQGWAAFIGTPNGKNQFWDALQVAERGEPGWCAAVFRASETGLVPPAELAAARAVMTQDEYDQEFEASFEASVRGSIYGVQLAQAREDGRLTSVPYDPLLPVHTAWDLGVGDATAIWFWQATRGGEVRLIDYYEASGEGLPHYVQVLQQRGYVYGQHWAPPDIRVRELGSGKSRLEVAQGLGIKFDVTRDIGLEDGIAAVRMLWPRLWIDARKCAPAIDHLLAYRRAWNSSLNEFKPTPVHDRASHCADALRYLAIAHTPPADPKPAKRPVFTGYPSGQGWMA